MNLRKIQVHVSRSIINEFKKAAKESFPNETFAFLLGRDAGTIVEIEELFIPMDVDEWCDANSVTMSDDWLPAARKHASSIGLKVVGDIHSHPYKYGEIGKIIPDCSPSEDDIDCGLPHINAVCYVRETKNSRLVSQVRFWGPMFSVEEHIK